jgi:N-acetylglutamate synthase-like GNAT family acetyltransferase
MRSAAFFIRPATNDDVPALERLIPESARSLSRGFYTHAQAEAAICHVFGVDSQLIRDGTYYVALDGGAIVGCGGWSWRRTLYGGDQRPRSDDGPLDSAVDAARIRAFFIAPDHARRGIGAALLLICAAAAQAQGFSHLELMSTMPGVPFYARLGFTEVERVFDKLPNGVTVEFARMIRMAAFSAQRDGLE